MVKIGELMMILDLHRQGLSVAAIARDCEDHPPIHSPRPGAAGLWGATAAGVPPRSVQAYLQERITAYPQLSGRRLLREVRDLGYDGGYTTITDFLRTVRPPATLPFEVRFETPPGRQAQGDFD